MDLSQALAFIFSLVCLGNLAAQSVPFSPYNEREKRLVQGISFSPDGKTIYITHFMRELMKARGDTAGVYPELAIYEASFASDGTLGQSYLMPFSGNDLDYEPTITPDGKFLFFNSKRSNPDGSQADKNNLWFSRRTSTGWSPAEWVAGINTPGNEESYPAITRNNRMYFVKGVHAAHLAETTNYEIYYTDFDGKHFTAPLPLVHLSADTGEADPWVAPDESYLIFTRFRNEDWSKTCDLYITFNRNGAWTSPVAMSSLNTEGAPDYSVAITPDGEWIYYRAGGGFVRLKFPPLLEELRKAANKP